MQNGHWTKHMLAQGSIAYEFSQIFHYFRREKIMKSTVNMDMLFIRNEFDTGQQLFFDGLWILGKNNSHGKPLYFFHFHEVKTGKPDYNQLERQLKYIFPNALNLPNKLQIRSKKFQMLFKLIGIDTTSPFIVNESNLYFYLWTPSHYHQIIKDKISAMGLGGKLNRNIKVIDVALLLSIAEGSSL